MTDEPFYLTEKDPKRFLQIYVRKYKSTYYRRKAKEVLRLLPGDLREKRFLDVGCCGGYFSIAMAKRGATGIGCDISPYAVNAAKLHAKRAGVDKKIVFKTGDAAQMTIPGQFDVILAKDVIEHIEDDIGFLRKISGLLSPRGRLIITTQNKASANYYIEGALRKLLNPRKRWVGWDPTHLRWYTPNRLRKKLRAADLIINRFSGSYYIPYEILYKKILKRDLGGGIMTLIDDTLGGSWPFDRHGWSISARAKVMELHRPTNNKTKHNKDKGRYA